jgi:tetratricopeptide (TPR) repeat protein
VALAAGFLAAACGAPGRAPAPPAPPAPIPEVGLESLPEALRQDALDSHRRARESPEDPAAVGRLGMLYFAYALPRAAADCFRRAAALDPRNLRWPYYLGLACERTGDRRCAAEALGRASEIDGRYAPVLVKLGDVVREGDPARAGALYREALDVNPGDPRALLGLGHCARIAGRREEALGHFLAAVRASPRYAEAHYAAAMILAASGRRPQAEGHLRAHAEGLEPPATGDPHRLALAEVEAGTSFVLQLEADRLATAGDVDEAIRLLDRASRTDPSGSTARAKLGVLLGRQGRLEEAAAAFTQVLAADPDHLDAKASLALALDKLGRTEEARRLFGEVLARHPDHPPALMQLGVIQAREGDTPRGLELMSRAVHARPAEGEYQHLYAVWLARAGRREEAIVHLRKASLVLPEHAGIRFTLGQLLASAGDTEAARREWEEAVRISPRFTAAYARLAESALGGRDAAAAVRWAEKACELTLYREAEHVQLLARAYRAAGRPEEADRLIRRRPGP